MSPAARQSPPNSGISNVAKRAWNYQFLPAKFEVDPGVFNPNFPAKPEPCNVVFRVAFVIREVVVFGLCVDRKRLSEIPMRQGISNLNLEYGTIGFGEDGQEAWCMLGESEVLGGVSWTRGPERRREIVSFGVRWVRWKAEDAS